MSGIDAITTIRVQSPEAQIIVMRIYPGDVRHARLKSACTATF